MKRTPLAQHRVGHVLEPIRKPEDLRLFEEYLALKEGYDDYMRGNLLPEGVTAAER